MPLPEIGSNAPSFSVPDQDERPVDLAALAGKWVVLYFYPKDLTPGCTTEACDFRDNFRRLSAKGAVVLGVSRDSARSHRNFREKKELPFDLLSDDAEATLCKAYGVWQMKKFMGREGMGIVRTTVLIDPAGKVARVWSPVSVKGHVDAVLAAF